MRWRSNTPNELSRQPLGMRAALLAGYIGPRTLNQRTERVYADTAFAAHWHMASIPRDSSSVIIVRSSGTDEALLIRRHADLAFAGGAWVFPGGKFEPSDASAEALEKLGLAAQIAPGLMVTACRETFEETGIVLATHIDGEPCDAALADSLQRFRVDVSNDARLFASVLADHGLTIDSKRLLPWAHWITPSLVPRRFDTRFFVAVMPPGQSVRCDSAEATELKWLGLRGGSGLPEESFVQAPPTRFSLGDLALCLRKHGTMDRLIQMEAARTVAPMIPKMLKIAGQLTVLLPWDPEYATAPGEGVAPGTPIPANYLQFPSRILPPQMSGMPSG